MRRHKEREGRKIRKREDRGEGRLGSKKVGKERGEDCD